MTETGNREIATSFLKLVASGQVRGPIASTSVRTSGIITLTFGVTGNL
jgi:hypothetical protein